MSDNTKVYISIQNFFLVDDNLIPYFYIHCKIRTNFPPQKMTRHLFQLFHGVLLGLSLHTRLDIPTSLLPPSIQMHLQVHQVYRQINSTFFRIGLSPLNSSNLINSKYDQNFYHPQTKLREGYVFTPVCDSIHGGAGVADTPLLGRPPVGRHSHPPAWADNPPGWSISGRYASYWNAFLFSKFFSKLVIFN